MMERPQRSRRGRSPGCRRGAGRLVACILPLPRHSGPRRAGEASGNCSAMVRRSSAEPWGAARRPSGQVGGARVAIGVNRSCGARARFGPSGTQDGFAGGGRRGARRAKMAGRVLRERSVAGRAAAVGLGVCCGCAMEEGGKGGAPTPTSLLTLLGGSAPGRDLAEGVGE